MAKRVLVQAGHMKPLKFAGKTGAPGEAALVAQIQGALCALLEADERFDAVPVPGVIPEGLKVDAAVFLHADGASATSSGHSFGFPLFDVNRNLAELISKEFNSIPGHPPRISDNRTKNESEYYGFRDVKTPGPEVLIEHGFMSNPTENAWMHKHVPDLAAAEYRALCKFFGFTPKGAVAGGVLVPQPPVTAGGGETASISTPLLGRTSVPPAKAVAHLMGRAHGAYSDADLKNIVGEYHRVCGPVNLNAHLAIAQMVHETGGLDSFWSQRPRRNPAGIGVTGEPGVGLSFNDWPTAIAAHTGRLLAYALADVDANPAQRALIDKALGFRPLPGSLRGAVPRLGGLAGTWAVDPGYGNKLVKMANTIRGAV